MAFVARMDALKILLSADCGAEVFSCRDNYIYFDFFNEISGGFSYASTLRAERQSGLDLESAAQQRSFWEDMYDAVQRNNAFVFSYFVSVGWVDGEVPEPSWAHHVFFSETPAGEMNVFAFDSFTSRVEPWRESFKTQCARLFLKIARR